MRDERDFFASFLWLTRGHFADIVRSFDAIHNVNCKRVTHCKPTSTKREKEWEKEFQNVCFCVYRIPASPKLFERVWSTTTYKATNELILPGYHSFLIDNKLEKRLRNRVIERKYQNILRFFTFGWEWISEVRLGSSAKSMYASSITTIPTITILLLLLIDNN